MASRLSLKDDLYDILGVPCDASDDDIKSAYKRQALRWHPDKNLGNVASAAERFKEVSAAYQVLSNPQAREAYNKGNQAFDFDEFFENCGSSHGSRQSWEREPGEDLGAALRPGDVGGTVVEPHMAEWLRNVGDGMIDAYGALFSGNYFDSIDQLLLIYSYDGSFMKEDFFADFDVDDEHRHLFESWFAKKLGMETDLDNGTGADVGLEPEVEPEAESDPIFINNSLHRAMSVPHDGRNSSRRMSLGALARARRTIGVHNTSFMTAWPQWPGWPTWNFQEIRLWTDDEQGQ